MIVGCGGDFLDVLEDVGWVGFVGREVLPNCELELLEIIRLDIEFPIEIITHPALHVVDLLSFEYAMSGDNPQFVAGVHIVANEFGSNHECR